MKLFCEKYKIEFSRESAVCEHLHEYCKFRKSCIVNFMTLERRLEEKRELGVKGECCRDENPDKAKDAENK